MYHRRRRQPRLSEYALLRATEECISDGLAARLHRYALARMDEAGFGTTVKEWATEVTTIDGNDAPANRSYCVQFENANGGYIALVGILTNKGWPTLGHGFEIGQT